PLPVGEDLVCDRKRSAIDLADHPASQDEVRPTLLEVEELGASQLRMDDLPHDSGHVDHRRDCRRPSPAGGDEKNAALSLRTHDGDDFPGRYVRVLVLPP